MVWTYPERDLLGPPHGRRHVSPRTLKKPRTEFTAAQPHCRHARCRKENVCPYTPAGLLAVCLLPLWRAGVHGSPANAGGSTLAAAEEQRAYRACDMEDNSFPKDTSHGTTLYCLSTERRLYGGSGAAKVDDQQEVSSTQISFSVSDVALKPFPSIIILTASNTSTRAQPFYQNAQHTYHTALLHHAPRALKAACYNDLATPRKVVSLALKHTAYGRGRVGVSMPAWRRCLSFSVWTKPLS